MHPLLKIRTVCAFVALDKQRPQDWAATIEKAAQFGRAAQTAYEAAGFEVQTVRVATQPFEEWLDVSDAAAALDAFQRVDAALERSGVGLFSAGPARTAAGAAVAAEAVKLGPRISCSAAIAGPFDRDGCRAAAAAVLSIANATHGEGCFQFCATANLPPGAPFFPAAYGDGGSPFFAVGCETSAILADALPKANGDLAAASTGLTAEFEAQLAPVEAVAKDLERAHDLEYRGIDASIAPLGTAPPLSDSFASLGLGEFGESGTLAVSSLVTGSVKAIKNVRLTGYTGLMLPPLEDAGLAKRAGLYSIHDLLMRAAASEPLGGDEARSR